MNRKINIQFVLGLGIFLALIACNQGENKTEKTETTDTTGTTQTEVTQPVTQETNLDAVKVAPNLYKTLADSLGIRILEVNYKPGDSSALHSHPDNALYVISGGTVEFTGKDGTKTVSQLKTGAELIRPGESHSVKNTGKTTLKAILVEVNRPKETMSPDAAMDATKVSPALYKLKKDSLGIRIIEINYKPGQSSPMHSHPDNAIYAVQGGTSEFTEKDGTKRTLELKTGMAMVAGGDLHSVKNTGKTPLKVILFEVNRNR